MRAISTVCAKSRAVNMTVCPRAANSGSRARKKGTCGEFARSIQIRMRAERRDERMRDERNAPIRMLSYSSLIPHALIPAFHPFHQSRQCVEHPRLRPAHVGRAHGVETAALVIEEAASGPVDCVWPRARPVRPSSSALVSIHCNSTRATMAAPAECASAG